MPTIRFAALLSVLVPLIAAPGIAQEQRLIIPEDYFEIDAVANPVISPDGAWVAYTVRETSLEDNESETRLWMVSSDGAEVLAMTGVGSSAGSPAWSPDGRYLSFLAARNEGETQVWALNLRGGEAQQLTEIDQGVEDYAWSPDAGRLVLSIRDPEEEEEEGEEDEEQPWVIDRLQFKRDYAGYLDRRRTHLYVFDLAGTDKSQARQLTTGDYDDSQPAWSPDGRLIAFVSNRTEEPDANSNSDIWVVPADSSDAEPRKISTNPGADSAPAWSPNGEFITHTSVTEPELIWYATTHLAISPASGGSSRVLTSRLDRNVGSPRFGSDGETLYFILEDSAERHLASIDSSGENFQRHIEGNISLRDYSMNDAGEIATLIGSATQPPEVFFGSGASLRQLTTTNRAFLDGVQLAEVENVTYASADGTEIEGFLYKPPGFDPERRYPTLLRIHGGPVSQYDFNFNFDAQLFAANGYLVVMTNPRGSSGYGQDFSHQLWAAWGVKDFEDVLAGVDYAIARGHADPERLGVGGWSYGGILTNYVITKSDRFAAAITGASEVLYRSNYGHDHYQRQWEAELGLPWETPEAWERISPFNDVANITTPTLVMGGEHDWNVPILNSEQLYQALKRLGRETQLVVYPGEFHGISKPSFILDRYERYLAWYDRYLK